MVLEPERVVAVESRTDSVFVAADNVAVDDGNDAVDDAQKPAVATLQHCQLGNVTQFQETASIDSDSPCRVVVLPHRLESRYLDRNYS